MEHSEQTTVMQTQFALLGEVPPSFTETSKAKKPENKNLNLVPGILPCKFRNRFPAPYMRFLRLVACIKTLCFADLCR